jgi:hypothetical protein
MKSIAEIEAAIAELDAAVRPIAKSGFNLSKPDWLARLRDHSARQRAHEPTWRPALDRAGIRGEADALISEIIDRYSAASDDERVTIRAIFRKYDCFRWAASLPHGPMTADLFRRTLVLFSIKDQEADWRDAIVWLDGLCAATGRAGIARSELLRAAAALSSDVPPFGSGRSTRAMLTDYADRFAES